MKINGQHCSIIVHQLSSITFVIKTRVFPTVLSLKAVERIRPDATCLCLSGKEADGKIFIISRP